ncbi:MAG: hypothetical protein PVH19_06670 [Planctomycetia bacterium]
MIRHPQRNQEPTAFFAFLSVISCTIGLLMLVLVSVTVTSFWGAEQVLEVPAQANGSFMPGRIFIECKEEGLVVHPDERIVTMEDLEDPARWQEGPYGKCLMTLIRRQRDGSAHFFIRPGGLTVFRKAMAYALEAGGGTVEDVKNGRAVFTVGQQLLTLPGPIRAIKGVEIDEPQENEPLVNLSDPQETMP